MKDISELTGFPEMLDGRVKTLHPKVHGGILHRRENPAHRSAIAEQEIQPIDMVVVNLYEFEKTAAMPGVSFEEVIENIDIGGPSMIRSAAKNFQDVAIVTSPADYDAIAEEMAKSHGELSGKPSGGWPRKLSRLPLLTIRRSLLLLSVLVPTGIFRFNRARLSPNDSLVIQQNYGPSIWGKPSPKSGDVFRRFQRRRRQRAAGSGQGTFLQQHCGFAGGVGHGSGI